MTRDTGVRTSKEWVVCALVAMTLASVNCDKRPPTGNTPSNTASSSLDAADPNEASPKNGITLVFGTIADNPQEEQDKLDEHKTVLPYLTEHLKEYGVTDVKLAFCHSPQEMADWIRDGKVDIFDESPFGAYLVHRLGGNEVDEPILNRWKNGNEKFGSVIFTKKDGGIKTIDELKGKVIVFRGDTSTANYFRPKAYLIHQGYKLVEKKDLDDPVAPDEIGYTFIWHSRDKEVETVMDGKAAAGGVSDEFVDQLLGKTPGPEGSARHPREGAAQTTKEDLRILARIPPVLRRVVTVRKSLDPKLKAAIKDLLLHMHESPEGRAVLATFGPSSRFSLADTDEVAYQGIIDQGDVLEQEVQRFMAKQ